MRDGDSFSQEVMQKQEDMFRMFVGCNKRVSYEALAAATGIPLATLKSYAHGTAMPLHNVLRMLQALPGEASSMLFEPSGFRVIPAEAMDTSWDSVAAEAAGFVAEICSARADGKIDHQEEARLRERTRRLVAEAQGRLQ